jgi:NAD(P)-dependent dehydrogenase (short-subunit alcohol dehydrogenase family)
VNISSDAAVTPYETWGAYGASKAALLHLGRIWDEELRGEGVRVVSIDPGDMDTPLHELAVPGSNRHALKRPEGAACEIADAIGALVATSPATTGSEVLQ